MVNSKQVFRQVINEISLAEEASEIESIAYLIIENALAISRTDVISEREIPEIDWSKIKMILDRINKHEPIQYILGEQEFYGRKFFVNPSVLIPRPETELLISEVIKYCKKQDQLTYTLLDIGTGSGCIPVTLALELKSINISGFDISTEALQVAQRNALLHHQDVTLFQGDLLNEPLPKGPFDIITSNPPYVTAMEKKEMKSNVFDYEPPIALFVPNEDPLLFYKAIVQKSKAAFLKNGFLALEINERFGKEVAILLEANHFQSIKISKDIFGKDRVITAHYENSN